jgi:tRNA U34 5-carboxymethylaminomethyl modifying GTPase MnmE/TrmE
LSLRLLVSYLVPYSTLFLEFSRCGKLQKETKLTKNTAYELRLKEFEVAHHQRLTEIERSSGQRREEIAFAEVLRSTYAIQTSTAIRRSAKSDENDPFVDGADSTYEQLKEIYLKTGKPIVLIAPFWDTARPKKVNDEGGFVDFRTALNSRYGKAAWNDLASKCDGYLKRPLYNTHRDISYILGSLPDLPIILVSGEIQGIHGPTQHFQRIHPTITFWNLIPDRQENYLDLQIDFFPYNSPLENTKEIANYSLKLQDLVGDYLSKLIGISSTAYYLYRDGIRPDLTKFEEKGSPELEILTLQMSSLYDLLCEREPDKSNYYQMERKTMLDRHGVSGKAIEEEIMKNMEYENNHSSPAEIRFWFAQKLKEMAKTLDDAKGAVSSDSLNLNGVISSLEEKSSDLEKGIFKFLIIGDYNRGKSSILNILLGNENLLPVGPTATTAFPIYVKFGQTEKVVVCYKNKSEEEISLEEFKERFSLNSNTVKQQIRKLSHGVSEWLKPLDHAEVCLPLKLLEQGIEFIDTAGLNHETDEDKSTLERISDCHAIFFVFSAEDQFTASEKKYLKKYVKGKINSVFFLINKWENHIEEGEFVVSQDKYKVIQDEFVPGLSEWFDIKDEEEVRNLWGDKIFDVYAKKALQKLKSQESLEDTGFPDFLEAVNKFLSKGRLMAELSPAHVTVEAVYKTVSTVLESLIATVDNKPEELRQKLKEAEPHFKEMKNICNSLKKSIDLQKKCTTAEVSESYRQFCEELFHDFDSKFNLPDAESLKTEKRNEYAEEISENFRKFQQDNLDNWIARTQASTLIILNELNEEIRESVDKYNVEENSISGILKKESSDIGRVQQIKVYQGQSAAKSELTASDTDQVTKMLVGGATGTVLAGSSGAGVAALTHAGLWLVNPAGAFVAFTPVGWALMGGAAVAGIAAAFWGRQSEVKKFREAMKQKLKELLPEMTSDKCISAIKDKTGNLFDNFAEIPIQMEQNVNLLEKSLKNLLESKEKAIIDSKIEKEALEKLEVEVSTQWHNINERYQKLKKNSEASV